MAILIINEKDGGGSASGDIVGKFVIDEAGGTKSLTGYTIDEIKISGVDSVADNCFLGTPIKKVVLDEGVKTIGQFAFKENKVLEEVVCPSTLTSIGQNAFYTDSNLKSINLPASLTTLGSYVFYQTALEEITLPNVLESIPSGCFYKCTNLKSISGGNNITSIGGSAFRNTSIKNYTVPSSVTTMSQDSVFRESKLETIDMSAFTGTVLGDNMFQDCTNLVSVILPSNVQSLGNIFRGCKSIPSIDLPASFSYTGSYAFEGCNSLMSLTIRKPTLMVKQSSAFNGVPDNCAIYVPADLVDTYKTNYAWSSRAEYIQAISE